MAEKSIGAGAGVYVLNKMVGEKYGSVNVPGYGSMDGNMFMAIAAALSAAGEYATKPLVPMVVGRYGGNVAVDYVSRGVVPVGAYVAMSGERPGWAGGARQSAITYAGSAGGSMLAAHLLR